MRNNFRYDDVERSKTVTIDTESDPGSWADALAAKADMVNSPPHYTVGGIETIDFIEAKLSPEEFRGYCKGNALKYLARGGHKDNAGQDYAKAVWYLNRLLRNTGT